MCSSLIARASLHASAARTRPVRSRRVRAGRLGAVLPDPVRDRRRHVVLRTASTSGSSRSTPRRCEASATAQAALLRRLSRRDDRPRRAIRARPGRPLRPAAPLRLPRADERQPRARPRARRRSGSTTTTAAATRQLSGGARRTAPRGSGRVSGTRSTRTTPSNRYRSSRHHVTARRGRRRRTNFGRGRDRALLEPALSDRPGAPTAPTSSSSRWLRRAGSSSTTSTSGPPTTSPSWAPAEARAATIGRKLSASRAAPLALGPRASRRVARPSGRGGCRPRRSRRGRACSTARRDGPLGLREPRARRARLLGRPAQRRGGRPRPPGRRLRAGARPRARQGRQGAHRAARRGGRLPARAATSARAARSSRRGAENAVFLSARGRRLDTSTLRRLTPEPAPAPPRVRDAPARGRRRPARDPGAARPQLALDDADLQPRRRPPAAPRLRPRAPALVTARTAELDGLPRRCSRRRAPRTVEAYRRDLDDISPSVLGEAASPRRRRTTPHCYLAELRADGLSPATISRRVSAARSFFAHQVLLGARADNPAAELESPRRRPQAARGRSRRARPSG